MKTFKILFSLGLLALMVGCGDSGKSPLVGKKAEAVSIWRLGKMDDKTFSKSWDDFSDLLDLEDFRDLGPLGNLEELFEDLAKQKVSTVYVSRNKTGFYFAFDVSSCSKKQKEEVEDILKDFSKELGKDTDEDVSVNMKFYDTNHGFYYVGPSDSEFKKSVHNAEFRSWKKEECWGLIQQSFKEPFSATLIGGDKNAISIMGTFPTHFTVPYGMRRKGSLKKYAVSFEDDDAVKFKARSILGMCYCMDPQKCVLVCSVTLDSKENAQKYQKIFTDYMEDLAKVLDDKDITKFLTSQKPKVAGNVVSWEYDASWMKKNQDSMEEFKDAVKKYVDESLKKEYGDEE